MNKLALWFFDFLTIMRFLWPLGGKSAALKGFLLPRASPKAHPSIAIKNP
jgi:hypothetical protein